MAGGFEDVSKEVNYFKNLFEIDALQKKIETKSEELKKQLKKEVSNRSASETQNTWNVILNNTGICMHCGDPAIPGDYVCYACNPG